MLQGKVVLGVKPKAHGPPLSYPSALSKLTFSSFSHICCVWVFI